MGTFTAASSSDLFLFDEDEDDKQLNNKTIANNTSREVKIAITPQAHLGIP